MGFLFADNLLRSLSWTFVHSLWLGLLLTVTAAVVILCTKRSSPALRYSLLCGSFFIFIVAVIVIFILQWNQNGLNTGLADVKNEPGMEPVGLVQQTLSWMDGVLATYGQWIVLTWMSVFMLKVGKMVYDFGRVRRLRNLYNVPAVVQWQKRFEQLRDHMHISRPVRLLESVLVKVPVVIGHLKPVILVPAGIFSNLPPDEIEAVLLHELAHIRRNDYLVNLIQRCAEMIFFFNPGLLWVSSLMRSEREICCDDVAIARTNDSEGYVNALIRFREHAQQPHSYAIGFPGHASVLVQRVSRIVYRKNRALSPFEVLFTIVSVVAICMLLVQQPETLAKPNVVFAATPAADHTGTTPRIFQAIKNSQEVGTAPRNAPNEAKKLPKKKPVARKSSAPEPAATQIRKDEQLHYPVGTDAATSVERQRAEAEEQRKIAHLQRIEADKQRAEAEIMRKKADKLREEADKQRRLADIERAEAEEQRKLADIQRQEAEKVRIQQSAKYRV